MNLQKIPGRIDMHVHLRDPGQTEKEDFYSGTSAALAGGITTVVDMPNNRNPIFTRSLLMEKMEIAAKKAVCDYGFYFGTDGKNLQEFEKIEKLVLGIKVYLNLTTGKILIEDENLVEGIFEAWTKEKIIIVHAEGDKIDLAIALAKKYDKKLHVTHISQKIILDKIIAARKEGVRITSDVTPHHLFLTKEDEVTLRGFAMMKPPLETKEDVQFIWQNLSSVDCIATDHAPHTREEKTKDPVPFGVPGLETMLPLLLNVVSFGRITLDEVDRLTYTNPMKILDISQTPDTFMEYDPEESYVLSNKDLKTKCGWSPFAGMKFFGKIKNVYIRGTKVYENDKLTVDPGFGKNILSK